MQIAMVGLGRMGANMAQRLLLRGHKVVAYDVDSRRATELSAHGALPATTLDEVVAALQPPRVVWTMVPAGRITEELITSLAAKLSRGDQKALRIGLASLQAVGGNEQLGNRKPGRPQPSLGQGG